MSTYVVKFFVAAAPGFQVLKIWFFQVRCPLCTENPYIYFIIKWITKNWNTSITEQPKVFKITRYYNYIHALFWKNHIKYGKFIFQVRWTGYLPFHYGEDSDSFKHNKNEN
jgi:hypothetical protein